MPKPRAKPNCVCLACGVEFYRWPVLIRSGKGKYCSRKCYLPALILGRKVLTGDKNPSWRGGHRHRDPVKVRARALVRAAVRYGRLKRGPCAHCGLNDGKAHGHHEDYSKPLDVIWLCVGCHRKQHEGHHAGPGPRQFTLPRVPVSTLELSRRDTQMAECGTVCWEYAAHE